VTLDFTDEVKNEGVASHRFTATERVFANATENPDNWCFCPEGYCNPSGVGNASTCRFNSPIFVSFPHYYLADPYYSNFVTGLKPQKDLHEFHIDLEPVILYFKTFFLDDFILNVLYRKWPPPHQSEQDYKSTSSSNPTHKSSMFMFYFDKLEKYII